MNGGEKSDSAIVALKPTNKAGRPGAELVGHWPTQFGHRGDKSAVWPRGLGRRPRRAAGCLPPSFGRLRSLQPVPREGTHSACTPAARREAGVQRSAALTPDDKESDP
jgi:hypothetical protein